MLLDEDGLLAAKQDGLYQQKDDLVAAEVGPELSGPYPGCMQFLADSQRFDYRIVGQTKHFAIFYPARAEQTLPGLGQ